MMSDDTRQAGYRLGDDCIHEGGFPWVSAGFPVAVQQLLAHSASGVLVGEFGNRRAVPLYIDNGDEAVGEDALY